MCRKVWEVFILKPQYTRFYYLKGNDETHRGQDKRLSKKLLREHPEKKLEGETAMSRLTVYFCRRH